MTDNQKKALVEIQNVLRDLSIEYELEAWAEDDDGFPCVKLWTENMNQYDVADLQDAIFRDFDGCLTDMVEGDKGFYSKCILIYDEADLPEQ